MKLDDRERAYLKQMLESPVWRGILEKIEMSEAMPRFSPRSEKNQYELWIYRSGGNDAKEGLLSIFYGKQVRINDE